jgi:hypothetical protein
MAEVRIFVRHDGTGWQIGGVEREPPSASTPRPYTQREDAIADALFAARMIRAMGDDAMVYVENSDGMRLVPEDTVMVWLKH